MGKRCPVGVLVSCAVMDPAGQSYGQPYNAQHLFISSNNSTSLHTQADFGLYTALPLSPCHYSYSLTHYTGLITITPYQHQRTHYRIHAPSLRNQDGSLRTLSSRTQYRPPFPYPQIQLPHFGYIGRLHYLHSLMSGSAVLQADQAHHSQP